MGDLLADAIEVDMYAALTPFFGPDWDDTTSDIKHEIVAALMPVIFRGGESLRRDGEVRMSDGTVWRVDPKMTTGRKAAAWLYRVCPACGETGDDCGGCWIVPVDQEDGTDGN